MSWECFCLLCYLLFCFLYNECIYWVFRTNETTNFMYSGNDWKSKSEQIVHQLYFASDAQANGLVLQNSALTCLHLVVGNDLAHGRWWWKHRRGSERSIIWIILWYWAGCSLWLGRGSCLFLKKCLSQKQTESPGSGPFQLILVQLYVGCLNEGPFSTIPSWPLFLFLSSLKVIAGDCFVGTLLEKFTTYFLIFT